MDTTFRVKQETIEEPTRNAINNVVNSINKKHQVIDLDSDSDDDDGSSSEGERKRARSDLPAGFLDPLPVKEKEKEKMNDCKQFWKAGDFEDGSGGNWETPPGGMDHVRVHPRFLHSNATSHKWVLGAFAELLDNSLDEVCNGATYSNIDMLENQKDGSRMLVIEDNGGGMDPDKLRQCMSLGYSLKSKVADTIGQYGNGFKTSTMRLGADVIVFTRCSAKNGKRATQSIGLLSYTFLRVTGKEDIVVPMVDYERGGRELKKIIRASRSDWDINIDALVKWSPFSSEADLLKQFDHMSDQGTRIIIYNLWEDDQGKLELDFDADAHDIQIRGVNRNEKNINMANKYPNSRHFLTYRHSLRIYASILYLRIPLGFRMFLRGKDIQHHNIVNDMKFTTEVTYRPQPGAEGVAKDSNIVAVVTVGFVKDAEAHIDVQGCNVYHKNRLIKPFWRLGNSAGSEGRGVIGVLEANFVEPAHDKQGFERTIVLSRLETRLIVMQKNYWRTWCHKIGYAPRVNKKNLRRECSPDFSPETSSKKKKAASSKHPAATVSGFREGPNSPPLTENIHEDDLHRSMNTGHTNGSSHKGMPANNFPPKYGSHSGSPGQHAANGSPYEKTMQIVSSSQSGFAENGGVPLNSSNLDQLVEDTTTTNPIPPGQGMGEVERRQPLPLPQGKPGSREAASKQTFGSYELKNTGLLRDSSCSEENNKDCSSSFSDALETLQEHLRYKFEDIRLLRSAMTHSSYSGENNEAFSILGKSIIQTTVALRALKKDIYISSKDLNDMISEVSKVVVHLGRFLGLQNVVRVSSSTDPSTPSIVCGAFRAIFGAVALDTEKSDEAANVFWGVHGDAGKAVPM